VSADEWRASRSGGRPAPRSISRRRLLAAGGLALSLLAAGGGRASAQARASAPRPTVVGRSRGGQPINAFHLGGERRRVLVLGGQHGSPEANAVDLADAILDYFVQHESEIPKGVGLDIIPVANPDGFITGSRQYLSGVDPNRNWASGDWERDAYDSLGRYWYGLGGPVPMSEPETRQLAAWISRRRPALVVNYHSAGGFVSTGQTGLSWDLANLYAEASGYPCFGPDRPPFGYPVTGAMDGWLAGHGIADIFVELTTLEDPETEENLAGLLAILPHLVS
jgi:zinc carboxypeptidase